MSGFSAYKKTDSGAFRCSPSGRDPPGLFQVAHRVRGVAYTRTATHNHFLLTDVKLLTCQAGGFVSTYIRFTLSDKA